MEKDKKSFVNINSHVYLIYYPFLILPKIYINSYTVDDVVLKVNTLHWEFFSEHTGKQESGVGTH